MLTLVATPIGNLEDISARALKALTDADAILAEDTRRSQILLSRYKIATPLISYHQFKEKSSLSTILSELKKGKKFALISDAGTPCINDPGQILVDACHTEGILVSAIPGPSSPIMALSLSGFAFERFQYLGFLPKKAKEALKEACFYPGVTVAFESPERLVKTLKILLEIAPQRRVAVIREMTKVYEEVRRGAVEEVLAHYEKRAPQGEIVIVLEEGDPPEEALEPEKLIELLQKFYGFSLKEAIKIGAKLQKRPKKEVYRKVLKISKKPDKNSL